MTDNGRESFRFEISLSVLNHLGRNLYRNFVTVLGEAISNSWDADARNVWIDIDRENSSFSIKDDGIGMSSEDFQNKFLKIGYSKRKDGSRHSRRRRPFIGAKGIGKLALLSCAERVSIFTKVKDGSYSGGVIDNTGLDRAIKSDVTPDEYPLEDLDYSLIEYLKDGHDHGTIIHFQGSKDQLKNSDTYLKKVLALNFKFTLIDDSFTIYVNGSAVGREDLQDLADATEFLWVVNQYKDPFLVGLKNLKSAPIAETTSINLYGFIATVQKPRHLKITGTEERATVDLFVNGRLREKNIIRHIPTQRIVENYIYGQIHFDVMDREGVDPFTSSREGVVEDDLLFQSLMDYLRRDLIPRVIDEWDKLRLDRGEGGDDENPRKSIKERRARDLYTATTIEYSPDSGSAVKNNVDAWIEEMRSDAEFNITAYVDCFLSENLIRKYIRSNNLSLGVGVQNAADQWKGREVDTMGAANISFAIRRGNDDLSYLDMDALAVTVEGSKAANGQPSLWTDAINFKPIRNAVGHTGLLTPNAKVHLNLTFENIKSRVKKLLSGN